MLAHLRNWSIECPQATSFIRFNNMCHKQIASSVYVA